jgi:hypothetical protein
VDARSAAVGAGLAAQRTVELTSSVGRYHAPPLVTDLDPIFGDRVMLGSAATQVATTAKTIVDDAHEVSATVYYQDLAQLPVDAITAATPTAANGGTESGGCSASAASWSTPSSVRTATARRSAAATPTGSS